MENLMNHDYALNGKQPSIQNNRFYYLALLDDQGQLDYADKTKQFRVEQNSEVRFRMRRGSPCSLNAKLLINKPLLHSDGRLEFTVTQPRVSPMFEASEEVRVVDYKDCPVEARYLEEVIAKQGDQSINLEFRVIFKEASSFFIQVEYFDTEIKMNNYTQPVNINVEPVMILDDDKIRCKELSILTVLSRQMGPLSRWDNMIENISQLGYNAIHYTPIQQYGSSYSHYSLADQTMIDDYYFGEEASKLSKVQRLKTLKSHIDTSRSKYKVLGIVDIVLNHTANNSPWLLEHPESAYNTDDCPHLVSAWLLDKALADFSQDYADRKIQECPAAPYINNEADLKNVLSAMWTRVINKLSLQDFFMCNVEQTIQKVRAYMQQIPASHQGTLEEKRKQFERMGWYKRDHQVLVMDKFSIRHGSERKGVTVDLESTACYFYLIHNQNVEKALSELKSLLEHHNQDWQTKVSAFMKEAMSCNEGTIRYFKLECKENRITSDNPIVKRYFSELDNKQQSKVAHNGWIMNADPMEDFAMKGWHYLRRTINIWSDSVKLRYGGCPRDSPFLWEHMSQYVSDMAHVFDGFRLDNAHSTPIHVCYYLLQVARSQNPNLYIMAELFTSSAIADAIFVQKLNINGMIREIQNTYDAKNLGDYFHQLTCREAVLGLIDEDFEDIQTGQTFKILKPLKPHDILYDCTHDNPAPVEKFKTGRIALSHLGLLGLADSAIASTWGFDHLLRKNLNVVTEKKLYYIYQQDDLFKIDGENPKEFLQLSNSRKKEREEKEMMSPEWTPEEQKSQEFEYEFVFYSDKAGSVQIAGSFSGWKPILNMNKQGQNKWVLKMTLPVINDKDLYEFKFVVNGKDWQINPSLPQTKDNYGNINNALYMPGKTQQQQLASGQSYNHNANQSEYVFQDIRYARKKTNRIHLECTQNNAGIFLHQQSSEVLVVIRQFDLSFNKDYDAYVSITRHPYYQEGGDYNYQTRVELPGLLTEILFAGYLEFPANSYQDSDSDPSLIKGATKAQFKTYKALNRFCKVEKSIANSNCDVLVFSFMPPSFTCVVKTKHPDHMKEAVSKLNQIKLMKTSELARELFRNSPLSGLNHVLYRCEPEEREISNGVRGPYGLQKSGQFKYAGIASFMHLFRVLKISGDMGHELFNNMREGNWLIDYTTERLGFMKEELSPIIEFLQKQQGNVKALFPALKPKYGSRVIEKLYNSCVFELMKNRMNDKFINESDDLFVKRLALASMQMWARVPSNYFYSHRDSMGAGLQHFSTGYMRCWGRDTFIALRGLLMAPGCEEEAKDTIIFFARTMRHGLIPNLHDRGNNTRFNARDATWFFLQAIKDFCQLSKTIGKQILSEKVELHFRDNDQKTHQDKLNRKEPARVITIGDMIQEILQCHAEGIEFREWNAGLQIDSQMRSEGFNVKIRMDHHTGFCFGGNIYNCGTWMDKMGSSEKTGNKGIPATPRDGAPIELVAMQYSVLRFMEELAENGEIQKSGVKVSEKEEWTYKEWADKMKANFEKHFWIPVSEAEDSQYVIDKKHVRRRGIYKDVLGSQNTFTEYQLRPNLCVALAFAPDLFVPDNARVCLLNVERILMEKDCMGIKTLDPQDPNYKGDYINSDDSQGWNYHQGPEWLWPVGFFLKARILFAEYNLKQEVLHDVMRFLIPHQKHILQDAWEGLPELTNSNGKMCKDSCYTQAWSISTILDAVRDLYYI